MINVLVFPCGSEIGLEVNNSLKYDKHINLYGLSSVPCHGKFVFQNYLEGISFINSDTFLDELNTIIDDNKIDVLIPAYDDVILFLSENRDKLHCRLVTSNKETCDIARSKIKTYEKLKGYSFIPRVFDIDQIRETDLPVFAKPDIGQGSQGTFQIVKMEDLERIKKAEERYVICELLNGDEYSVDCFTDAEGNLLISSMRSRNRIKNGISVNTSVVELTDEVRKIAECINKEIAFNGVWFFQVKADRNGKFKLLEIAPRVAGSMSLSRVRGFNYILNSVYQTMGYTVKGIPHLLNSAEEDRALSNEYILNLDYDTVYIDLDDTIIINGKVSTEVMAFLYQCLNKGIKIKILSRHRGNEIESLKAHHIDISMFDEIIHIDDPKFKSECITDEKAIFIDDAFRERYDVSLRKGIPVFDLDCISALMDR